MARCHFTGVLYLKYRVNTVDVDSTGLAAWHLLLISLLLILSFLCLGVINMSVSAKLQHWVPQAVCGQCFGKVCSTFLWKWPCLILLCLKATLTFSLPVKSELQSYTDMLRENKRGWANFHILCACLCAHVPKKNSSGFPFLLRLRQTSHREQV